MFLFGLPHSWGLKKGADVTYRPVFTPDQVWQEGPFSGALCFARANEVLLSVSNKAERATTSQEPGFVAGV